MLFFWGAHTTGVPRDPVSKPTPKSVKQQKAGFPQQQVSHRGS
jgi:hypothetical protein